MLNWYKGVNSYAPNKNEKRNEKMELQVTGKIICIKHFKSKPEKGGKDFYSMDVLLEDNRKDADYVGYSTVSVFMDEPIYNGLLDSFKPLCSVKLAVFLNGNRVNYRVVGLA